MVLFLPSDVGRHESTGGGCFSVFLMGLGLLVNKFWYQVVYRTRWCVRDLFHRHLLSLAKCRELPEPASASKVSSAGVRPAARLPTPPQRRKGSAETRLNDDVALHSRVPTVYPNRRLAVFVHLFRLLRLPKANNQLTM